MGRRKHNLEFGLVVYDILAIILASFLALLIRYEFRIDDIPEYFLGPVTEALPLTIIITLLIFALFRLYSSLWKFAGQTEMQNIVVACVLSTLSEAVLLHFFTRDYFDRPVPKSFYFLYLFLLISLIFVSRFSNRFFRSIGKKRGRQRKAVMVIGAGDAGNIIIKEILQTGRMSLRCIIDDDPKKKGRYVQGIKVVGGREEILECAERYGIDEILITIPSASPEQTKEILGICKETGCKIRTLPGLYQLMNGEVSVSRLRDVEIEDLLGREPVRVNGEEISAYVTGKVVLVTGGGGSIGSELCRQIAAAEPKQLLILDIYENNAYAIQQELKRDYPDLDLVVLIASVRNEERLNWIFKTYHPQIVYHAAAHKHVPLMEDNPCESIKNNVLGTWNTAVTAGWYGAEKFVLISTDKAVNPTSIMGASKRICEMIVQSLNKYYETNYVAVRFGNVLGSNGSVIPLFKEQIKEGGPVTVTDPRITRYFMTIPEAVSLVLQAGAYAKGGEIFVLDMGEPVKILDLAENLIKLSGYKVDEIGIKITGLRPGEKLYEEVLMGEEGLKETANHKIRVARPLEIDDEKFWLELKRLEDAAYFEDGMIREKVREVVPTYVENSVANRKAEEVINAEKREARRRKAIS